MKLHEDNCKQMDEWEEEALVCRAQFTKGK